MLTIFLRAIILYLLVILTMRGMGKRLLGQLQPYEFALVILISDLVASPMGDLGTPLVYGVMPILALLLMHSAITLIAMKSDRFKRMVSGKPSILVSQGVIQRGELKRLCLTLSDLLEGVRESGQLDIKDVDTVILEANGKITAFPNAQARPVTISDAKLTAPRAGLPLPLVMDGQIQPVNLRLAGQEDAWLHKQLARLHLSVKDAYLLTVDTLGRIRVQDMGGGVHEIDALNAADVRW